MPTVADPAQRTQSDAAVLRKLINIVQRRLHNIIRAGKQPHAKASEWPCDQAFVLRLEKANQQIAIAIEKRPVFLFALVGIAGENIDG